MFPGVGLNLRLGSRLSLWDAFTGLPPLRVQRGTRRCGKLFYLQQFIALQREFACGLHSHGLIGLACEEANDNLARLDAQRFHFNAVPYEK